MTDPFKLYRELYFGWFRAWTIVPLVLALGPEPADKPVPMPTSRPKSQYEEDQE